MGSGFSPLVGSGGNRLEQAEPRSAGGGVPPERRWGHPTHLCPRVSRCHRAGGLVPDVRLWSLSPLQPDRIWLPSLRLVSGSPFPSAAGPIPAAVVDGVSPGLQGEVEVPTLKVTRVGP